ACGTAKLIPAPRLLFLALVVLVCPAFAAAPRRTIESYALLAIESLRAKGLTVESGDVGVNSGGLVASGIKAPGSQLVADSVRLAGRTSCAGVFGDSVRGASAKCAVGGSDGVALFGDPGEACGFPKVQPACATGTKLTVGSGTPRTLAPGVYGDLVVTGKSPAIVDLVGGRYVFCSLRAARRAQVRVHAPTEIVVAGDVLLDRATVGPAPDVVLGPGDIRIVVAGEGVKLARGTTVTGRVCAPGARLTLRGATLRGSAVARRVRATASTLAAPYTEDREPCAQRSRLRNLYFGDLHVHTTLSFDAYAFDVRTTPAQAYAFAAGDPVQLPPLDPTGVGTQTLQLDRPLDFVALTDHSEFLGEVELCTTPGSPIYDSIQCESYRLGGNTGATYFGVRTAFDPPTRLANCGDGNQLCLSEATNVWGRVQQAAADAYDRTPDCRLTSFVAYEYTASALVSTLHRNVIFRSDHVPFPTTVFEQPTRQGLWAELRTTCVDAGIGCDVLAIPHNSNESNGKMFLAAPDDGAAQASLRGSMEPLLEVYQHKGAS
ncbi:MAG: DUF3604 domain-containing protein, partial [Candidatus Binatia bacterium]